MEQADSTSNSSHDNIYLKSWSSCDTIADISDLQHCCINCKAVIGDRDVYDLIQGNKGDLMVYKSVALLICHVCAGAVHLHCFLNNPVADKHILQDILSTLPYICQCCQDEAQQ